MNFSFFLFRYVMLRRRVVFCFEVANFFYCFSCIAFFYFSFTKLFCFLNLIVIEYSAFCCRLPIGSEAKHDVLSIDNTMVRESQVKRLDEMKVKRERK